MGDREKERRDRDTEKRREGIERQTKRDGKADRK